MLYAQQIDLPFFHIGDQHSLQQAHLPYRQQSRLLCQLQHQ
jgi:hypothetical protein